MTKRMIYTICNITISIYTDSNKNIALYEMVCLFNCY